METLDAHLILHIVSFLSPHDFLQFSATCKKFNHLITSSSGIQLKLYSHLYNHPIDDPFEETNVQQNAHDKLLQLLATEGNIRHLRPRITNIKLPGGEDVVGVHGNYYLTANSSNISRWDFMEAEQPVIRTLWWMNQDDELQSKKILMPIRPIQYRVKEDIKQQILVIIRSGTSASELIITVIEFSNDDSPQQHTEFTIPFEDAEEFSRLVSWIVPGRRIILQIKGVMKLVDLDDQRIIFTIRFIDRDNFVNMATYVHLDTELDGRPHMLYYYRLDLSSAQTETEIIPQISPVAAITLPATMTDLYNYPGAPSQDPSNTRSRDVDVFMSGPDGTECNFIRFEVLPLNATRSDISIILPITLLKYLVAESLKRPRKAKTCVQHDILGDLDIPIIELNHWLRRELINICPNWMVRGRQQGGYSEYRTRFVSYHGTIEEDGRQDHDPLHLAIIDTNPRLTGPEGADGDERFRRLGGLSDKPLFNQREWKRDMGQRTLPSDFRRVDYLERYRECKLTQYKGSFHLNGKALISGIWYSGSKVHIVRGDGQINILDFGFDGLGVNFA